ncbi:MAG: hypothetical protein ACOC9S_07080 [Planctomycetota bacterium]
MIPPLFVYYRRQPAGRRRRLGLLLPVFLLYPILLALYFVLVPVALVAAVRRPGGIRAVLWSGPTAAVAICAARGTSLKLRSDGQLLHIRVW